MRPTKHPLIALTLGTLSACANVTVTPPPVVATDAGGDMGTPAVNATGTLPALSGGTLLVSRNGSLAVVADPERDRIVLVDLGTRDVRATLALAPGDEPGRIAEDGAGRFHVALRRGGALVTLDPSGTMLARRAVCAAPRGVAWEARTDRVHVACVDGSLVSFPSAGGAAVRTLALDTDLRDVVVQPTGLAVSTFRSATLLFIGDDGTVTDRSAALSLLDASGGLGADAGPDGGPPTFDPAVAWRTIDLGGGTVGMLHQRGEATPIGADAMGAYGGDPSRPCGGGIVHSTFTTFGPDGTATSGAILAMAVLAMDAAISPDGTRVAIAAPGNQPFASSPQVSVFSLAAAEASGACATRPMLALTAGGSITSVAFDPAGDVLAFERDPATLHLWPADGIDRAIPLGGAPRGDVGFALFHRSTTALIACASCHAEGGDDGRVWNFASLGPRRTIALRGGILGTEPFHWGGEMHDMTDLVEHVFVGRMSGPSLSIETTAALAHFVDQLPPVPVAVPSDPTQVVRGQTLFESAATACTTCHSGPKGTNNTTVDVGTGGAFQVPALHGVAARAPYMHNGCAVALRDRFTDPTCGGTSHGSTAQFTPSQLDDLIAYLQTR